MLQLFTQIKSFIRPKRSVQPDNLVFKLHYKVSFFFPINEFLHTFLRIIYASEMKISTFYTSFNQSQDSRPVDTVISLVERNV